MSYFSQHPSLQMDSIFPPNSPLKNSDEFFPNWNQFFMTNSSGYMTPLPPLPHLEGSSINDASNHGSSCLEQHSISNEKQGTQSFSSMEDKAESEEQVSQVCELVDHKKRKSRNGSSPNSANSKDVKHTKGKKQKGDKEAKKDDHKNDKKDQNKAINVEEPPKGYIHVRARRGQATDSHSLAERVRREKISERMKMLQGLVPGCDKVTGKALMLDEIINYVQSLQTQVEFLSMRLASLDPMVYNFGPMDHLDPIMPFGNQEFMNNNNNNSMALPMPPTRISAPVSTSNGTTRPMNCVNANAMSTTSMTTVGTVQPPNFMNTNVIPTSTANATVASAAFPCPPHVIDSSTNLLQLGQKPSVLPIQDDRSLYWGSAMEDQHRLSFFNQFGFGATN